MKEKSWLNKKNLREMGDWPFRPEGPIDGLKQT